MKFETTPEQDLAITDWLHNVVYPKLVKYQRKHRKDIAFLIFKDDKGIEYPYTGAIGGGLTYHIQGTGLGWLVSVEHVGIPGKKPFTLDVTELGDFG